MPVGNEARRYCPYCGTLPEGGEHGRVSRSSVRLEGIEGRWSIPGKLPDGARVEWQGDPRGSVARLILDASDGDGIAVPTRY